MRNAQILIAGFGGQGILFAGKFLAYQALSEGRQLSWLPSYGPEMRGGTANCSVIISDDPVGSPIVTDPDVLVCMNLPSLDKYENAVKAGGIIISDSSLISRKVEREDVKAFYIPATQMANAAGMSSLANMIMMGKLIRETAIIDFDGVEQTMEGLVSARHKDMLALNIKALRMGYEYAN